MNFQLSPSANYLIADTVILKLHKAHSAEAADELFGKLACRRGSGKSPGYERLPITIRGFVPFGFLLVLTPFHSLFIQTKCRGRGRVLGNNSI